MEELLEKLRLINHLLQKEGGFARLPANLANKPDLPFQEMIKILAEILAANTYLMDPNGNLLGYHEAIAINNERVKRMLADRRFPSHYADELAVLTGTTANIGIDSKITVFPDETKNIFVTGLTTIIPIFAAGKRLGSLIFARLDRTFDESDLILAEHSATVMGVEILHFLNLRSEEAARAETAVDIALRSLSFSETKAIKAIFQTITGDETIINASKIAAQNEITRSVIVNALRKMESASILETKSLGMKGTYIKISSAGLHKFLMEQLGIVETEG